MKGDIKMNISESDIETHVNLVDVDVADKCVLVERLLSSLNTTSFERLLIINTLLRISKDD